MDAETIGALMLFEDYYYINGKIPKTDAECARVCKLSVRKFARNRSQILEGFDSEGRNADLDASISETERIIATKRDAGSKGGTSKSLAYARNLLEQKPSQPEPQPESQIEKHGQPESSSSSSPPAPPPSGPRAREAEAVAARALGSLPTSAKAHPGWRGLSAWIDQLLVDGAEPVDIVIGITQCLRSLKDQPPSTFGYFTAAIDRAREARTAPLPATGQPLSSAVLLQPETPEWTTEHDRLIAAGEKTMAQFMVAQAAKGLPWQTR